MLLELNANPGNLSPAEFAQTVAKTGLKACVVTRTNSVENMSVYLDALQSEGVLGFPGVEIKLEKGAVFFVPARGLDELSNVDWTNGGEAWTASALSVLFDGREGLVVGSHPYYREGESPMGDRVYRLKALNALVTSVGRGQITWDRLAEGAATKLKLVSVASGGGGTDQYGNAALILPDDVKTSLDLVDAIKNQRFLVVEFDEAGQPRKRIVESAAPRRDDRRDDRRRDERGPRGPRRNESDRKGGRRRGRRDD